MTSKSVAFQIDEYYHLLPVIQLARVAIAAERNLRTLEFVRRTNPDVDQLLTCSGVEWMDDEEMSTHAEKALEFVANVIERKHELDVEGYFDDK